MNGFSIGTIFMDKSHTLVSASDSSVFDFGKLVAASGADSLSSGVGRSEMLGDWATWLPRINESMLTFTATSSDIVRMNIFANPFLCPERNHLFESPPCVIKHQLVGVKKTSL